MNSPIIIFDLNRTLYDPERDALVEGATNVLNECRKRGYCLVLVSHNEKTRLNIIDAFGLRPLFHEIHLVDEKTIDLFIKILSQTEARPESCFAIGDVIPKEIFLGNQCGMKTIWFQTGKFSAITPTKPEEEPTFTVQSLDAALAHIPVADAT